MEEQRSAVISCITWGCLTPQAGKPLHMIPWGVRTGLGGGGGERGGGNAMHIAANP